MAEVLIIRSAGFQQLDKNLPEIVRRYPQHRISILTHEHGVPMASKYADIDEVYTYPYMGAFQARHSVPELHGKSFDAVVVLVTNLTGAGFSNVMKFSLSMKARERIVCNLVSELREVSAFAIRTTGIRNALFAVAAGLLTALFAMFALVLLPIQWKRITKNK